MKTWLIVIISFVVVIVIIFIYMAYRAKQADLLQAEINAAANGQASPITSNLVSVPTNAPVSFKIITPAKQSAVNMAPVINSNSSKK